MIVADAADRLDAVRETLTVYFDALYESSASMMSGIFHSRGVYATADESPPLYRDRDTYLKVLEARVSPASRNEPRADFIDHIEFAGEHTAWARVRCSIGDRDFLDLLTLVHDQGRWQIIAKVFHIAKKRH